MQEYCSQWIVCGASVKNIQNTFSNTDQLYHSSTKQMIQMRLSSFQFRKVDGEDMTDIVRGVKHSSIAWLSNNSGVIYSVSLKIIHEFFLLWGVLTLFSKMFQILKTTACAFRSRESEQISEISRSQKCARGLFNRKALFPIIILP